ncbi:MULTISPECIES: maleylpyruvate isomerase N-terminal domain-containing protein [unclassified Streptomyces]|uniref:maleylpyruvate isomerase N-terminal domain-containing protein n=1 Tax=unclassified Streptomyces TaxID=2593676 RepID=UPI001CBB2631|nr:MULTISPECIES: maleylpyruvate isomerase N-terminal domain-containing protein [unclassified Streptomyces]WPO75448.1 maleylpyruvate isomerase N-terminal domain-containing protein [Streptomyces sp. KN37]
MTSSNAADDARVGGAQVRESVAHCVTTLSDVPSAHWSALSGGLEWTRWETLEHLADDLLTYALRFGLAHPMAIPRVPLRISSDRPGGPGNVIFGDRSAGPEGLLSVVQACGGLLATAVDNADPTTLAPHVFGASDPEGFAAMGVVETLVHTYDIVEGLPYDGVPPEDLSRRALARLFPDVAVTDSASSTLLWATGRIELPGRPRRTNWRWYGEPSKPR